MIFCAMLDFHPLRDKAHGLYLVGGQDGTGLDDVRGVAVYGPPREAIDVVVLTAAHKIRLGARRAHDITLKGYLFQNIDAFERGLFAKCVRLGRNVDVIANRGNAGHENIALRYLRKGDCLGLRLFVVFRACRVHPCAAQVVHRPRDRYIVAHSRRRCFGAERYAPVMLRQDQQLVGQRVFAVD